MLTSGELVNFKDFSRDKVLNLLNQLIDKP
ncbi:hypothetical protein AAEX37_02630 [Oligella sp. MSHR50489EDL]